MLGLVRLVPGMTGRDLTGVGIISAKPTPSGIARPAQQLGFPAKRAQRLMRRLYTRPRTTAVTQPKTRLKAMPSIHTLIDEIGCSIGMTENSAIHAAQPFEAGISG